jgi:hypothetical protein
LLLGAGCNGAVATSKQTTAASTAAPTTSFTVTRPVNVTPAPVATTSLGSGRVGHTATLLASGEVFVAGGIDSTGAATDETAIVTPTTVKAGPRLSQPRALHSAALLGNGQVLIIGGQTDSTTVLATTEIYDPVAGAVTAGPSLATAHTDAFASVFGPAGQVKVIVGGGSDGKNPLASVEVYDPANGRFSSASSLLEPLSGAQAATMDDGTVVVAGGANANGPANAELYDPSTGAFTKLPLAVQRAGSAFGASGSEAIVMGGVSANVLQSSCETYDMAARAFAPSATLLHPRADASATVVAGTSGTQLVLAGGRDTQVLGSVEILRGTTLQNAVVEAVATLQTPRYLHTATALPNGHVLVIGGLDANNSPIASMEDVDPSAGTFVTPPTSTPTGTGTTVGTGTTTPGSTGTTGTGTATGTGTTTTPPTQTTNPPASNGGSSGGGSGLSGFLGTLASAALGALGQTIAGGGLNNGVGGFAGNFVGNLAGNLLGGVTGQSGSGIGSALGSFLGGLFGGGSSSSNGNPFFGGAP